MLEQEDGECDERQEREKQVKEDARSERDGESDKEKNRKARRR